MKLNHEQFSRIIFGTSLVLLIGLSSFFAVQWLRADTLLGPVTDAKIYFPKTVKFMDTFSKEGWLSLGKSLPALSFTGRPPLYQLLSIPFLLVLGRSMDSAALVNLLFQALLSLVIFQIGKLTSNARTGFLAALLVNVYPPLVQLARIYTPHFALAACVSLALWRLLALHQVRSGKNVWLFILALVFGIFIHATFVFTLWLPTLIGLIYILFFQVEPRRPANARNVFAWLKIKLADPIMLRSFFPALLLGIALVAGWYLSIGMNLLNVLVTVSSSDLTEFRGYEFFTKGLRLDGIPYFWWYLITMPEALSTVFTGFFVIGVGYTIWKRAAASLFLIASFLGAYLVFANLHTMTWLHFAQVLPLVALISVTWVGETKNKVLGVVLWTVLLAASLFVYYYVSWGTDRMARIAIPMGAPLTAEGACQSFDQVFCPNPPSRMDFKISEILKSIVKDPDCRPNNCGVLVLDAYGRDFTGDTFLYYKTVEFPESPLTILQFRFISFGMVPFNFEVFLQNQLIVYVKAKSPPNSYFGAAIKLAQNPPESFAVSHQLLAEFVLPGGRKARLLKRVSPLTLTEAQDVIRLMDVDEKFKFGQYRVLAPLYAQAEQFDNALQAYRKALEYEPEDASLYFGLAGVYEALGQLENAASAYRQVIAIAPASGLAHRAQAWLDSH